MRRRCWAPLAGLFAATVAAWPVPARGAGAGDTERVNVRAELGAEHDSNVHRTEQIADAGEAPVSSPLLRGVLGWSAADSLSGGHDVAFSVLGAGKLFAAPDARSENVAIVETSGSWRRSAGARTGVGLAAAYYEAVQAGTPAERAVSDDGRDFRSIMPTALLSRALGDAGIVSAVAGYRWFVYKPLRSYDFQAPALTLQYRWTRDTGDGGAEWDVALGTSVELRRFAGARLVAPPGGCGGATCAPTIDPAGERHHDQFVTGQIEITRTGRLLVGAGYAAQWNRSNSYTESLLRHIGILRLTTPLLLGVYLAARAELVVVEYAAPVALAIDAPSGRPSTTFEEESRSRIRAELSRDLGEHLQLIARASYYTNFLDSRVAGYGYRRLTTTLSLAFSY